MPVFFKEWGYRAYLALKKGIVMAPQPRPAMFVGRDAAINLCESIAHMGLKKILIVTDKPLMEIGIPQHAIARLNVRGVSTVVYDGVKPDPTVGVVDAGLEILKAEACDGVLAIGGGSSIDAAKVMAIAVANGLTAMECVGLKKGKEPALPLFAVPTTAGTGSEVTLAAVISDDETHEKLVVADPKVIPAAAALDPEIMRGLPAHITAATGMDALTHAVESYINTWDTPECLQYGRSATRLVLNNLERACANGDDMGARESMAIASYYAGLAFTTCLVGYVHAVSHQLGGHYSMPHGLANAMVLPHVLELLKDTAGERLAELAVYCELGDESEPQADLVRKFIDRIWALNEAIGIPRTTDVIKDEHVDEIVKAALKEGAGYPVPRFLERDECTALVQGLRSAA
ncbi:MAG: iron-containing alcohol dehydrogenase [Halieaceae bacterium]|nr:iron-containing alcohol dehydrogenase [Halieaceae bacterium]